MERGEAVRGREGRQTRALNLASGRVRFLRGRLARYVRAAAAASVHHNHYVRLLAGAARSLSAVQENAPPPPTPGVVRFLLGDNSVTAPFFTVSFVNSSLNPAKSIFFSSSLVSGNRRAA